MRPEEADMLARWVRELRLSPGTVCLNVGSSTKAFREREQPHITERFIRPLEGDGIRFVHCDMKRAEGVDEIGDVFDPSYRERLKRRDAGLLVCSNLLEHLTEPRLFAKACGELIKPGGYGLFTIPLSYPYHPDPIDTMLRLKPGELAAMMPDWDVVKAQEIEAGNYLRDLRASGEPITRLLKQTARVLLPFYRPHQWKPNAHRLLWLFKTYRMSLVLLRKPA
jgi:SAM-dependent methyltransferase